MFDKIINIASIHSGYHFTEKIENDKNGTFQFIQLKDIDVFNKIDYSNFHKILNTNIKTNQILRNGDILIKCRGTNFTASVFNLNYENVIASSHFFILRLFDYNLIMPEYFSWFFNDEPIQKEIRIGIGGTHMQVLNKKFLGELKILIPPIEIQQKIVYLKNLNEQEQKLSKKKVDLKNLLMDLQLRKIINIG
jgi:restriction endonuclease S subunit